jgi:anti-anti-sigma factor
MNNPRFDPNVNVVRGTTELVRGQDQKFLEELKPLVRSQSVHLDLSTIQRIDAAGLAALITLYCAAREAGHSFTVSRPAPHVREILSVVGLDRVLLSHPTGDVSNPSIQMAETAA